MTTVPPGKPKHTYALTDAFMEIKKRKVVAQSCPTLCFSMNCSLFCSSVHEILQTRVLEWVAISFSKIKKVKLLSRVRLFVTPWTVPCQAPQSMEFSRQEYWSGLPFPSPGDLPDPGTEPGSPTLQTDAFIG